MQRRGKKDQEKGERVSILIPIVHNIILTHRLNRTAHHDDRSDVHNTSKTNKKSILAYRLKDT
ncbi:MAG TPA: hypothetical protein VE076_04955 [Nitrososphaeraceae archaeon]|nr:hypothetical protein [Nitrososphaeraceae archaeon]